MYRDTAGALQAGSFKPFVAVICQCLFGNAIVKRPTFEVKENVGLVILEHLSDQLRVHVVDVDLLKILIEHHDRFIEFLLCTY